MNNRSTQATFKQSRPTAIADVIDNRISIAMMLNVEIDHIPFHIHADGKSAIISFDRLSDALALFRKYKSVASSNRRQIVSLSKMLSKIGLTVYYHNRYFGFIGPKANVILSKFFNLATSPQKRAKL
jgi:hypothetical protein